MKRRTLLQATIAALLGRSVPAMADNALAPQECGVPVTNFLLADGFEPALSPDVPAYYLPSATTFIHWDFPALAHAGVDVDYKMTGYDWFDRPLQWSLLSGPAGMHIAADGRLHWTPAQEGSACVWLQLRAGSTVVRKSFVITVQNDRCVFVDGAAAAGGDGTRSAPFRTLLQALATVAPGQGSVVYIRQGLDYSIDGISWFAQPPSSPYRRIADGQWSEQAPLVLRNFPGESVRFTFNGGSGMVLGMRAVVLGLELVGSGSLVGENGCLVLAPGAIAKQVKVRNYNCSFSENCCGVQFRGSCLLDGVESSDNFDRGNPASHNNSNYLFYGTSGLAGAADTFVIDCISSGDSGLGFKIKHAGSAGRLHLHRCVSYGARNAFGGACNRSSLRHSLFCSGRPGSSNGSYVVGLTVTDPSSGGQVNLSEGMLVDRNSIIATHAESVALEQADYAFASGFSTPAWYSNNLVQNTSNSAAGHGFLSHPFAVLPTGWTARFVANRFISTDATRLTRIGRNQNASVALLNSSYGQDNSHGGVFEAVERVQAGHRWRFDPVSRQLLRDGNVVT